MTAFFVVLLVFSFFIIFLTFSILGTRVRIKKSLLNIDYEYYTILLSQRLSAVTYNEIVLDNKFFRKKEWPGYIPESILLKLKRNRKLELVWLVSSIGWGSAFTIFIILEILIPV